MTLANVKIFMKRSFPLYLCSLLFSPRSKNPEVRGPKSEVRNRFAKDAASIPNAPSYIKIQNLRN